MYWTDQQIRLFPESWCQELLRDPSPRVSRVLNVSHTGPRSVSREQGLVGQPPSGLTPLPINIPRDPSSIYAVGFSRLRSYGIGARFTDICAPSPRILMNVAALEDRQPLVLYYYRSAVMDSHVLLGPTHIYQGRMNAA